MNLDLYHQPVIPLPHFLDHLFTGTAQRPSQRKVIDICTGRQDSGVVKVLLCASVCSCMRVRVTTQ